jgi:hypothetical protein
VACELHLLAHIQKDNELVSTLTLDSTVIELIILTSAVLCQVTGTCDASSGRKFVDNSAVWQKRDIIEHHFSVEEEITLDAYAVIYLTQHFIVSLSGKNCALVT